MRDCIVFQSFQRFSISDERTSYLQLEYILPASGVLRMHGRCALDVANSNHRDSGRCCPFEAVKLNRAEHVYLCVSSKAQCVKMQCYADVGAGPCNDEVIRQVQRE